VGGVAVIAAAAVAIFFFSNRWKRGRKNEGFTPALSGGSPPDAQPYFAGMQKAELSTSPIEARKEDQLALARYEADGMEQQHLPLMELEANERDSRDRR
jgi:hypothetical protein